jgi:uncharacterized protein
MLKVETKVEQDSSTPLMQTPVKSTEPAMTHGSNGPSGKKQGRKIWIDIDNSPHVPFFLPIIEELRNEGFELLLTARDMYQVVQLLEFHHLSCKVIGSHYGKNKVLKVIANCLRAIELIPTAAKFRPNLALSHGSRGQILVCKALGIRTLMMHDYEYSTKTGFLEPNWTLTPDVIPEKVMSRTQGHTLKYPGLKEDVYVPQFQPDPSIFGQLGISPEDLVITLRPPATEAHYHNPESEILFEATLQRIANEPHVRAVTLPRNARQEKQLREKWVDLIAAGRMIIPEKPVDGLNLIWFSDLVISGGGTMNREAAALGVPVYSLFRGKIGAVDQYLADKDRLILLESTEDVRHKIIFKKWDRPAKSNNGNRPALKSIVNSIIKIMESR